MATKAQKAEAQEAAIQAVEAQAKRHAEKLEKAHAFLAIQKGVWAAEAREAGRLARIVHEGASLETVFNDIAALLNKKDKLFPRYLDYVDNFKAGYFEEDAKLRATPAEKPVAKPKPMA